MRGAAPAGAAEAAMLKVLTIALRSLAMVAAAAVLSGCVSSKEIAQFATQSAEGATFQRLLDDYQSAPLRQARFVGQGNQAGDSVGPWLTDNVAQRQEQVKRTKLLLATVRS